MLYVVPTPIGNLGDITLRALETLKQADIILSEDTRHTRKLLSHFEVKGKDGKTPPLQSFHDHSREGAVEAVMRQLDEGLTLALVSDAGMPLVSDPGFKLVREAVRRQHKVEVLPGACAFVTAVVGSGLPTDAFSFFGFLPVKTGARKRKLEALKDREETLVFYESRYKLKGMLEDALAVLGDREASVARELTKKFEETVCGKISEIIERFSKGEVRGEFVVMIAGNK